ncbi:type VI secretion system baseplate subunit TssG [Azospirillum oryzae]|uniref:Type VI secretion system baseplate subunit TssG n=1 Tax=Azospirillum oryzae TaxID=286727 RepID=A0A6N1AL43_9PROT|nr:type VI secretion system baseplate subunit TssG [Azospirillum oryzae]KAA0590018.1 type VI secretion system baseplate subunit TssG [Azospirillum oryzae]QKS51858.1 type VI secretion system baseplate subunit TssG [Azospirillum oryzae]
MARPRRQPPASVIDRLFRTPHRFDFFQAVRVLEWQARRDARDPRNARRHAVGHDHDPREEVVRLRAETSLTFPGNQVAGAEPGQNGRPPTVVGAFLGLVGPLGVLPQHYTEIMIRSLRERNRSLRDFFDVFHHRSFSLFYRAWAKYRLPVSFERGQGSREPDPVSTTLSSFVGIGQPSLTKRLVVEDETLLHYSGLLSRGTRSAVDLQEMLSDFLGRPVMVESFVGGWLPIAADGQTRLPTLAEPEGRHCRLGIDALAGDRAWDVQGKFRLRIGPLNHDQFRDFMPEGREFRKLRDLVRMYVGPELDFELQVTLQAPEVPGARLAAGEDDRDATRLGWNGWVLHAPSPVERKDAVFPMQDL